MCPDRDLISAYVDGEVPSPWSERLEDHLGSCPGCAALAKSYALLGEDLRAETSDLAFGNAASSGAAFDAAVARGRERLDDLLAALPSSGPELQERALKRRRSISMPLPLAAAAAVLVILLGGATTVLAVRPGKSLPSQAMASGELIPRQSLAQPASMEELLHYLDSSQGQVTLTINLPTNAAFGSASQPVIVREGQVLKGTTVGGSSP
jgi:anti-sigma factor RsiW